MTGAREKEDRTARLAARLRDNLKRRKAQARAAADVAPPAPAHLPDAGDLPE